MMHGQTQIKFIFNLPVLFFFIRTKFVVIFDIGLQFYIFQVHLLCVSVTENLLQNHNSPEIINVQNLGFIFDDHMRDSVESGCGPDWIWATKSRDIQWQVRCSGRQ